MIDLLISVTPKEGELRGFCLEVFTGQNSRRGLREFERKATERIHKVFGPDASVDSVLTDVLMSPITHNVA